MKMHTTASLYLKVFWQRQSPRKTHHSHFSSIVSSLTISTTGRDKLPLLQAALVAIFQEVQYILALLIRVEEIFASGTQPFTQKIWESRRDLISLILEGTTATIRAHCFSISLSVYTLGPVYLQETPCLIKINVYTEWISTWQILAKVMIRLRCLHLLFKMKKHY